MRKNSDCIAYLPMLVMAKAHQVFIYLTSFPQNSINPNKIELGKYNFDTKMVVTAIKLASKIFSKMQEHINDNSVPKDVPAFTRGFLLMLPGEGFFTHQRSKRNLPPPLPLSRPNLIPTVSTSLMVRSRTARKSQERNSPIRA